MIFELEAQNYADAVLKGSRTFQSMMFGAVVCFFINYPLMQYLGTVAALQNLLEGTAEGG